MMSLNMKTCCFTGHRKISADEIQPMMLHLDFQIKKAIQNGVDTFISGGALGFDMVAANLVLCLKEMGEPIKLVLVLPCKDQDKLWSRKEQRNYQNLLEGADGIEYISEQYIDGCMKKRNKKMVNCSDMCIAYLREKKSGTGQTVRMAKQKGIPVVIV